MKTDLFDFSLPEKLIAQRPAKERDHSRMMLLDRQTGAIEHRMFTAFPKLLAPGDLLVLNDTRVFGARLLGKRASGGKIELLLLRPDTQEGRWEVMVRGLGKLTVGEKVFVGDQSVRLVEKRDRGTALIDFGSPDRVDYLIDTAGEVPLPPYIHRPEGASDAEDRRRYQTVFAKEKGSCAAPTAGLHFTNETLATIRRSGVSIAYITLHVGPGTFRPVTTERMEDHPMDHEWFTIGEEAADTITRTRKEGGRIVAVGSTVTRTLEASAHKNGVVTAGSGATNIFIHPGFDFRVVDRMLTNFHLPRSTLLALVSALAGRETILAAYREGVKQRYRFFSYGDCMFIG